MTQEKRVYAVNQDEGGNVSYDISSRGEWVRVPDDLVYQIEKEAILGCLKTTCRIMVIEWGWSESAADELLERFGFKRSALKRRRSRPRIRRTDDEHL